MPSEAPVTPVEEAFEEAKVSLARLYLRVEEPGTTRDGNPKREVTLSTKYGNTYFKVYHTLSGFRLAALEEEVLALDQSWVVVAIGAVTPSAKSPEKYGRVEKVLFPSEIRSLFAQGPEETARQQTNVPF